MYEASFWWDEIYCINPLVDGTGFILSVSKASSAVVLVSRRTQTQDTDFGAEGFMVRRWGVEVSVREQVQSEWQLGEQVSRCFLEAEEIEVS